MKIILSALVIVLSLAAQCFATAIVVEPLPRPEVLLTSPSVTLVSHGAQSIITYRATIEVENQFTSKTLSISIPKDSLRVYTDESGEYVFNPQPSDEANIWVRYDSTAGRLFHLRRMKPAYERPFGVDLVEPHTRLEYTDELTIPPMTVVGIDLDFDLPAGEAPQRFTLVLDKVDLGQGFQVDAVKGQPIMGRGVLRYLRQAFAPLLRQERQERTN